MSNSIDERLAERIRTARIESGETQSKLGKRLGLSTQQIWKYEMGNSRMTVLRLVQFALALDRPLSFFLEDLDAVEAAAAMKTGRGTSSIGSSEGRLSLMRAYGTLDAANRRILNLIGNSLAEAAANEKPDRRTSGRLVHADWTVEFLQQLMEIKGER
jgi:transcriptional regulator with XRE-family HTH domain